MDRHLARDLERRATRMNYLYTLLATGLLVTLLSSAPPTSIAAEDKSTVPAGASPSNTELDALLKAKDWTHLSSALSSPRDSAAFARVLDWLHVRLDEGAGFMVAYAYMRNLWTAGNALKAEDPAKDLRLTAGMIALYAYELIVLDGAKCEDQTAPGNRVSQLFSLNPALFSFLKSRPANLKEYVVTIALAFEKKTASLRGDDDLLCRDGMDQMKAGLERGTQQEVPNTSGHFGKTIAVTPPAGWTPKFVPPETYIPIQKKARAAMRENLLKLIQ
jgi:hypothetical protein